ncbi:11830_t:CDS:2 [Cetraspora pellucida]|uniref:11830_t:CDS:1 n=1 Tax=Cetraspora pellucida TaxID=1433469 RepID=A0ACA9L450_9GLOM|nr:11830_t:CDS:2 [Cetraspora pellucida]
MGDERVNVTDNDFINMFRQFLKNQNQLNQYLSTTTQQQQATNDHLQTSKDDENVLTWLLQIELLFKAKKVEDKERLQYVIAGLKNVALQWYLNLVQNDESHQPFMSWTMFSTSIKASSSPTTFKINLLGQIEEIAEADKVMNFREGLKNVTKTEVNYHVSENLDNAIKLAVSYDSAMYEIKSKNSYILERNVRTMNKKVGDNIKKGHIAKDCRSKNYTSNKINQIEKITQRKIDKRREENSKNLSKSKEKDVKNYENLLKIEGKIEMQDYIDLRRDVEALPLQKYDLILGKPWLYDLNPRIN